MIRDEVVQLLGLLKVAYPNFYKNITKKEAEQTISLYEDMFKNTNQAVVTVAVKELIGTLQYPPTIADIKNKIDEITTVKKLPTELWEQLCKALKNSGYHSVEEFEKLSPEVQAFVKSPNELKNLGLMDSDVVHSVIKGQFFRQIEVIQKREADDRKMLPESKKLREMISQIGKALPE